MKTFTIKITNNKTNEILLEEQTNAIVGACSADDIDGATNFGFMDSVGRDLVYATNGALSIIGKLHAKYPLLEFASRIVNKLAQTTEIEESNEDS